MDGNHIPDISFANLFNQFFKAIPKLCLISLFGAAVARLDLLGIFFLSAYGVLNVLSARNGNTTTARITWIVTAVYTSLYLAAQTVLQVMYKYPWASFHVDPEVVRYFGFQIADSEAQWSRIYIAPGLVLIAAAIQLTAIQKYRAGKKAWGVCLELDDARAGFYRYIALFMGAAAGCLYPGLANLPYVLFVIAVLILWARGRNPTSLMSKWNFARTLKICQVYTCGHGVLIYLWQLRAVYSKASPKALEAMPMLGIYRFFKAETTAQRVTVGSAAAHTLALIAMFAALGLAAEFPKKRPGKYPPARLPSESRKAREDPTFEARHRRTLEALNGTGPHPRPNLAHQKSNLSSLSLFFGLGHVAADAKIRGVLLTALQIAGDISWEKIAEQYVALWAWATSRPSFVGFFLALMATVCPSWPALGLMFVGLLLLVIPEKWTENRLRRFAPGLLYITALWAVAAQVLTAISQGPRAVHISANARSLGLYVFPLFDIPFLVPFGSMITAVAALAGHCRLDVYHANNNTEPRARSPIPSVSPPPGAPGGGGRLHLVADPTAGVRPSYPPADGTPTPTPTFLQNPSRAFSSAGLDDGRTQTYRTVALVAKQGAQHVVLVGLHYVLRLMFPAVTFLVGVSRNDLLHVAYVAAVLFGVARNVLLLKRFTRAKIDISAILGYSSDIVKYYALFHSFVLYIFCLRNLDGYGWGGIGSGWPGSGSVASPGMRPRGVQRILEILGLWRPQFEAEILPVVSLLAFATWYSALDAVLKHRRRKFSELMKQLLSDPETSSSLRPVLEHVQGRLRQFRRFGLNAAIVSNTYLLLLLLYVVVVAGVKPGTCLGIGYLALGLTVLTLPPTHPGDASRLKRWRWVFLWLLAVYSICDFVVQYVVTFRVFRDEIKLSRSNINLLRDVVGIDPEISGRRLVASLVRSGIVLGLLNGHRALSVAHQKRAEKKKSIRARERQDAAGDVGAALGDIPEAEDEGAQSEYVTAGHRSQGSSSTTAPPPLNGQGIERSSVGMSGYSTPLRTSMQGPGPSPALGPSSAGPARADATPSRVPPPIPAGPSSSQSARITASPLRTPVPTHRPILDRYLEDQGSAFALPPTPTPPDSASTSRRDAEISPPPSPPGHPTPPPTEFGTPSASTAPRCTPLSLPRTAPTPPRLHLPRGAAGETPERCPAPLPLNIASSYGGGSGSRSGSGSDVSSDSDSDEEEEEEDEMDEGLDPTDPTLGSKSRGASLDRDREHVDKRAMMYRRLGSSVQTPAVVFEDPPVVHKYGGISFFQRASILMSDPAAILALFFDAGRLPSIIHLAIIAAIVIITLLRPYIHAIAVTRGLASHDPRGFRASASAAFELPAIWRFLISLGFALLYLYGCASLLLQYLVQLPEVDGFVDANKTVIKWGLGFYRFCAAGSPRSCAERALRSKVLLVLCARLCLHARTWRAELPREVKKAAPPGRPCPLFYPRPDLPWTQIIGLAKTLDKQGGGGLQDGGSGESFAFDMGATTPVDRAKAFFRGFSVTPTAERPTRSASIFKSQTLAAETTTTTTAPPAGPLKSGDGESPGAQSIGAPGPLTESEKSLRWTQFIEQASFTVGIKTFLEDPWPILGAEATALVFLLAIYSSLSIVSLVLLGGLLIMTLTRPIVRARLWRFVVHPAIGALLLYQFLAYVGLPEPKEAFNGIDQPVVESKFRSLVSRWLAANPISYATLWFLFLAFSCVSIAVVEDRKRLGLGIQLAETTGDDPDARTSFTRASRPILLPRAIRDREKSSRKPVLPRWAMATLGHLVSDPQNFVFVRLEAQSLCFWTLIDHFRFELYKHASSAVLILVFILSLINTSILHGAYLIWALVLFRLRSSMLQRGTRVFRYLAAYNLFVILAMVLFQLPWRANGGIDSPAADSAEKCEALQIVGLFHLRGIQEERFALLVVPDILLFLMLRLQMLLSASVTYSEVSSLVMALHNLDVENRLRREERVVVDTSNHAWSSWDYSRKREARVARLNEGIHARGGAFGVSAELLDFRSESMNTGKPLLQPLTDPTAAAARAVASPRRVLESTTSFRPVPAPAAVKSMDSAGTPHSVSRGAKAPGMFQSGESQRDAGDDNYLVELAMQRNQGGFWSSVRTRLARFISSASYNESRACLLFIVILFVVDLSILSITFAVGIFAYAIVSQRSAHFFWASLLFYAEVLLVANYAVAIPYRLGCGQLGSDPASRDLISAIGLHVQSKGVGPLYLTYLALLGHNYALIRSSAAREVWKRRQETQLRSLSEAPTKNARASAKGDKRDLGSLGFGTALRRMTSHIARRVSRTPPPMPMPMTEPPPPQTTMTAMGLTMAGGGGGEENGRAEGRLLQSSTMQDEPGPAPPPTSSGLSIAWAKAKRFTKTFFYGAERGPHYVTVTFRCPHEALGPPGSVFALQALDLMLNSALREEAQREAVESARSAASLCLDPFLDGHAGFNDTAQLGSEPTPTPTGTAPTLYPASFRDSVNPRTRADDIGPYRPATAPRRPGFLGRLAAFFGPHEPEESCFPLLGCGRPLLRAREVRKVDVEALGAIGLRLLGEEPATFGVLEVEPGVSTPFSTMTPFGLRATMSSTARRTLAPVSEEGVIPSPGRALDAEGNPLGGGGWHAMHASRTNSMLARNPLRRERSASVPEVDEAAAAIGGPNLGEAALFVALVEVIPLEAGGRANSREPFAPKLRRPAASVKAALSIAAQRGKAAAAAGDGGLGAGPGANPSDLPLTSPFASVGAPPFSMDDSLLFVAPPYLTSAAAAAGPRPPLPRRRTPESPEFPGFVSPEVTPTPASREPPPSGALRVRFQDRSPPGSPSQPPSPVVPEHVYPSRVDPYAPVPRRPSPVALRASWQPSPSFRAQQNPLYDAQAAQGIRNSGSWGVARYWQQHQAARNGGFHGTSTVAAVVTDVSFSAYMHVAASPNAASPPLSFGKASSRPDSGAPTFPRDSGTSDRVGPYRGLGAMTFAADAGSPRRRASHPGDGPVLPPWLRLLKVEASSRPELDLFTHMFIVDVLCFIYVAFAYRDVFRSSSTLRDSLGENIVPGDYLGTLLFLFFLMVFERVSYSVGSTKWKAVLHLFEVSFYSGYLVRLYWFLPLRAAGAAHVRIFALMKMLKLYLSARQLRSGWPSPLSYRDGKGRTAPFWMSRVNFGMWLIGVLYMMIPFLWELRLLIDWLCSTSTLMLFDYFKLEEISRTLFNTTFNRVVRSRRKLGEKEPTWRKAMHGFLLLSLLIVLLWVPLLVFANSGISLRNPSVVGASLNATILIESRARTGGGSYESVLLPIYAGGYHTSIASWRPDKNVVPLGYSGGQMHLICSAEQSDVPSTLELAPSVRSAALRLLQTDGVRVSVRTSWVVERSIPLNAPSCQGTFEATLADATRVALVTALQGSTAGPLVLQTVTGSGRDLASAFPLVWRLKGTKACSVDVGYSGSAGEGARIDRRKPIVDLNEYRVFCALVSTAAADLNATAAPLAAALRCTWQRVVPEADASLLPRPVEQLLAGAATGNPLATPRQCPAGITGPQQVVLLDQVHAGLLGQTLGSLSISGLYIGFVFAIGRIMRGAFSNLRARIPYDELPSTAKLRQLVQDIYVARAEQNLLLEEKLYWALIAIYRDPQALMVLSSLKED